MIDVKQIGKPKNGGGGSSVVSGGGYVGGVAEEAKHAAKADKATFAEQAEYANRSGYASRSAYADLAYDLAEDSPATKRFLSRIADDVAEGRITFQKGLEAAARSSFAAGLEAAAESLFSGGAVFGKDGFASGLTGYGAKIGADGNGEMRGLTVEEDSPFESKEELLYLIRQSNAILF